ncbi:redoxin domain-containing protein [Stieleria marina]|uniref:redoxin domain-containing protein n=1 Tax=Stieleria marina TaxID=1930275 RepID=UPI003AF3BE25
MQTLASVAFLLSALVVPSTALADTPSPKAALSLEPVQDEVTYEKVPAADVAKCEVRDIDHPKWTGWEVVAGDGTMLRRFADTNKDKKIDLWSYYNFGIEVYRDVDADFNGKADQYQWLGTSGTRWGLDENEDGKIDRWQRISVEEVSAEVVAAVREGDESRFARMLATERELRSIGLGEEKAKDLSEKAARAARSFGQLAKRQNAVGPNAKWVQFASSTPGIVPSGTDGSTKDVLVYENAVAMFEQDDKSGQLLVGTIVRVGDAWRLVDLPSIGAEGEGVAQGNGHFFTPGSASMASAGGRNGIGEATQELVVKLEKIDAALTATTPDTKVSTLAKLHDQRAEIVESLIETAGSKEEKETWVRQLVDTVTVAVQSGSYPDGLSRLSKVASKFCRGNEGLSAYAEFQSIGTEYVTRQTKDADFPKVQEWYLKTLNDFIDRYPKTPETAQALLQLALSKEFEDKTREAIRNYRRVASDFANTDAGRKAAGAVRRLESEGRRIEFEGATIDGKQFSLSKLRGNPVVIHYWATWCEPCKQDMKALRRMRARYPGLQLVGVNVDTTRDLAVGFLKENELPWTQLFEDGGLESSPLSNEFGVQTLPTMMLIDRNGKMVRHNLRVAELDGELESMTKPKS